jgi:hypothetical protein
MEELNIKKEINDLIEDDTFKYNIVFKTPDDLIANFTTLEEKNLFLIQQTQEAEQAFEEKNHEFIKVKKKYENDIRGLENGLKEVKDRIRAIEDIDKEQNIDNARKTMPKDLEKRLRQKIKEVYAAVFSGEGKGVESNSNGLYMLGEIEK